MQILHSTLSHIYDSPSDMHGVTGIESASCHKNHIRYTYDIDEDLFLNGNILASPGIHL